MEQDLLKKFEEQEVKLEKIYASVEKLRRYFFWTSIITVAMIILPLIGLIFIIPWFLGVMSQAYGGLL